MSERVDSLSQQHVQLGEEPTSSQGAAWKNMSKSTSMVEIHMSAKSREVAAADSRCCHLLLLQRRSGGVWRHARITDEVVLVRLEQLLQFPRRPLRQGRRLPRPQHRNPTDNQSSNSQKQHHHHLAELHPVTSSPLSEATASRALP